jgi:hypothetical protein
VIRTSIFVETRSSEVTPDGRAQAFDLASILGVQAARLTILALNRLIDLLAMDGNLDRGRDPQSDFVTSDIHHGDDDVIANDDTFVSVTRQDQHRSRLLPPASEARDHP